MNQFGLLLFGGITSMLIVSKSKSAKTNEAAADEVSFVLQFLLILLKSCQYYIMKQPGVFLPLLSIT